MGGYCFEPYGQIRTPGEEDTEPSRVFYTSVLYEMFLRATLTTRLQQF